MKQSVSSLLGIAKNQSEANKGKAEAAGKKDTFHSRHRAAQAADPVNVGYKGALALGKAETNAFLAIVRNPEHPSHETNLRIFKQKYGMDSAKLEADLTEQACKDLQAHPYEMEDRSYEDRVFKKYRPQGDVTPMQIAFYDNFQKAMRDKWDREGYKGDKAFVEAYTDKYDIKANDNLQELKDIQLKK